MYKWAPPLPEPKYQKPYIGGDGQRSFSLMFWCASLLVGSVGVFHSF